MIDENFLQSAIHIRRTYLKMSNNMDFYRKAAESVVERLEETMVKVGDIQKEAEESRNTKKSGFSGEKALKATGIRASHESRDREDGGKRKSESEGQAQRNRKHKKLITIQPV